MPTELGPHDLTSETSHPPYVVSMTGVSPGASYADWMAFDGTDAAWLGEIPCSLQIDLGTAAILASYALRMSSSGEPIIVGRCPTAWTMQGSNDGATWNIVDTVASETGWVAETVGVDQTKTYICHVATTAYRYFRFVPTANGGDGWTMIDELYLYASAGTAQTITFPAIANHVPTDAPFALGATASSGLAVVYSVVSGPATVAGNTVTLSGGAGEVVIQAAQAGGSTSGSEFAPHDMTSGNSPSPFVVTRSSADNNGAFGLWDGFNAFDGITAGAGPSWQSAGDVPQWLQIDIGPGTANILTAYKIVASTDAQLPNLPNTWTVSGSNDGSSWTVLDSRAGQAGWALGEIRAFAVIGAPAYRYFRIDISAVNGGNYVDIAELYLSGNATAYSAAPPVDQTFNVTAAFATQTITFGALANHVVSDAPFALAATSSSGLAVTYAVTSGPATMAGNIVTLTGPGTVTIQATQAGNETYSAAAPVNQTFNVTAIAAQTITFPAISNRPANAPPFALLATASSGLPVSYAVTSGLATISGNTLTITGVGSATVQATQAGNGAYAAATPVDVSFNVTAAQRGFICFDQIRAADRTGNGDQLLTYTDPPPTSATSPGTPGQVSYDTEGFWYWCYALNQWARIGPTGYGSAAASPPAW